ncbi:MAG: hypothetical protein JW861_10165 [Bacteroidales bacterium]|nr:hypothetical protein [Bacteroidales bacterium]
MIKRIGHHPATWTGLLFLVLFFVFKHPEREWDRVISSDGKAYYAYLTALFIYHDLDYHFVDQYETDYYPSDKVIFKEFRIPFRGDVVNIAFPGQAVLWLPFFLGAHLVALLSPFSADGYSLPYQYGIGLANIAWLWLGCVFLFSLLLRFGASRREATGILWAIALGTNIPYFAIVEGSMTHICNFTLITGFLLFVRKAMDENRNRWFLLASLFYGLIVITRPTNGIFILLVPFMAGNFRIFLNHLDRITTKPRLMFFSLIPGVLVLMILPVLWYAQTGYFLVYSYGEAGFNFASPHLIQILFSYHKGWFVYTPIALLAMAGFAGLYRTNTWKFWILLIVMAVHIYILSCWWNWHYTSKFSQRVFIDFYALIAILLLYLFRVLKRNKILYQGTWVLTGILILLSLFQTYQHRTWVFPHDRITSGVYWDSFFRTIPTARVNLPADKIENGIIYRIRPDTASWSREHSEGQEAGPVFVLDHRHPFTPELLLDMNGLFTSDSRIIRVQAEIHSNLRRSRATVVVEFQTGGHTYSYNPFYLGPYNKTRSPVEVVFAIYPPEPITPCDQVKVIFFCGDSAETLTVRDPAVEFLSMTKDSTLYPRVDVSESLIVSRFTVVNDMEEGYGWSNTSTLTGMQAYEGYRSCRTGPDAPFSVTYEGRFPDTLPEGHGLLAMHSMIFSKGNDSQTRLVIDISAEGYNIIYRPFFIGPQVSPGQWSPVCFFMDTDDVPEGSSIKAYFWNPSSNQEVWIDNMVLDFITLD